MKTLLALFCCLLFLVTPTFAQTVLRVPLSTGMFVWDNPAGSTTTQNVITCTGVPPVTIPMPASFIAVNAVVSVPGNYTCTLYAENAFDKSAGPDPAFPAFTTGHVPITPTALRLEVR